MFSDQQKKLNLEMRAKPACTSRFFYSNIAKNLINPQFSAIKQEFYL